MLKRPIEWYLDSPALRNKELIIKGGNRTITGDGGISPHFYMDLRLNY